MTAPAELRQGAAGRLRRPRGAPRPRRGEAPPRRLRVRQRRLARAARRVRRLGRGGAVVVLVRRFVLAVAAVAVGRRRLRLPAADRAALVGAHLVPAPLRVDRPRPRRALPAQPGAARGGDRAGEQVRRERALERRRDRADAADAADGRGDRAVHRRQGLRALRPERPRDQRPLRRLVPPPPARQVRRRAHGARRLQRRPAERRPLAGRARGHPVPGDARLRRAGRAAEGDLPARVRVRARAERLRRRAEAPTRAIPWSPWRS